MYGFQTKWGCPACPIGDETGQVWHAASFLLRLPALTTNCHLAQDILPYFTGIAPALYRHPCGGFLPFRSRLLFMAFSVVQFSAVRLVLHVRLASWFSWPVPIVTIRLISDLSVAGRHSASFSPSSRLGHCPRLRFRLRLVSLVSSFRLEQCRPDTGILFFSPRIILV